MAFLRDLVGCLVGILCFLLVSLVVPEVKGLGFWTVGIEVAFCFLGVRLVNSFPWGP
jgi:hypothetical protein